METKNNQYLRGTEISLQELFGEKTLEELLEAIASVTGLGIVISDYTGRPMSKMVNFKSFCKKMRESNSCQLSDASGIAQAMALHKHFIYCCPCGLMEVVIPIVIENHYLGGFLAGQVRCHNIPDSVPHMQVMSEEVRTFRSDPLLNQELENIPFYDYKAFCDISELIYHIVTLLGEKTMANIRNFRSEKDRLIQENQKLEIDNITLQLRLDSLNMNYDSYFLYNLLTDISNMAYMEDAEKTSEMILHLASWLREQTDDEITIEKEREHIHEYMRIFRIKYKDVLNYDVHVDNRILSSLIPANIIIPFLKSDMYCMMEHILSELSIRISIEYEQSNIFITIKSAIKEKADSVDEESKRLFKNRTILEKEERNVIRRLKLLYDTDFQYIIDEENGGSRLIKLRFPCIYNMED